MFYFDEIIRKYEKTFSWNDSLLYLEKKFFTNNKINIINSLVGFSWYYLIEGPVDSGKYKKDDNEFAMEIWKKYIDIGTQLANNNQYFNFIAGYTLSLHGFLINPEYEHRGTLFIKNCREISNDLYLKMIADNFLKNQKSKKYILLKNGREICDDLFSGDSLLDKYFREIYLDTGD